jgi:hypothetical protein
MERKALIIAGVWQGCGDDELPGVVEDAKNYRSFLTSSLGGGWYSEEVTTLTDPSKSQIASCIKAMSSCDYSMVIFAGHGEARFNPLSQRHETEVWGNQNSRAVLNVVQAHGLAAPVVTYQSNGKQNPEIERPRTGPYFPFAIKI